MRERERPGGERGRGRVQENAAYRTHGTSARAWDSRRHEKRREAGYAPAHRTHGTSAGAWDSRRHEKRREAALQDTCETDT